MNFELDGQVGGMVRSLVSTIASQEAGALLVYASMFKLQAACIFMVAMVAALYFYDVKKKSLRRNRGFVRLLAAAMAYFPLEVAATFCVNHLDLVPRGLNAALHLLYLASIQIFCMVNFRYVAESAGCPRVFARLSCLPCLAGTALSLLFIGRIEFNIGVFSNYSSGIPVYLCYGVVLAYLLGGFVLYMARGSHVQGGRFQFVLSFALQAVVLVFQALVPSLLVISILMTLIILGTYVHSEGANAKELLRSRDEIERLFGRTIMALSSAVEAKDLYTNGHSRRVAEYSAKIALRAGKGEDFAREVYRAGLLHDIGKIKVPDSIINKAGRLTDEEFAVIKGHPEAGFNILKEVSPESTLATGARYHHERYDGRGYPEGLAAERIPEIARIIGVADAYDAMTSNRSYRAVMEQSKVRAQIEQGSGSQFDPRFAKIMLSMIDEDKSYDMRQKPDGEAAPQ